MRMFHRSPSHTGSICHLKAVQEDMREGEFLVACLDDTHFVTRPERAGVSFVNTCSLSLGSKSMVGRLVEPGWGETTSL